MGSTSRIARLPDSRPGIRRLARGRGFRYLLPNGRSVTDGEVLVRIKRLVIPPAWKDVWISLSASNHLQATGRDAKNRKQYLYHDQWREMQERTKFAHLASFAKALPRIRRRVRRDLKLSGSPREKILAAVVHLLDTSLIRVGNEEYARENHSYGLTTLRNHHAKVQGDEIRFNFRGKSGKVRAITIKDPKLARIVKKCQQLPGQELFEYEDDQGSPRKVGSQDINVYLQELAGSGFTAKEFRTWHGSVLALSALRKSAPFKTKHQLNKNVVSAVTEVSEALGNTPAVCRKSYIHPLLFEAYEANGLLHIQAPEIRGLTVEERMIVGLMGNNSQRKKRPIRSAIGNRTLVNKPKGKYA